MWEPLPAGFKAPQLEAYDSLIDPIDHLESFRALILLHRARDRIMCRAFPSTLKKMAPDWYSDLKAGSIYSFDQTSRMFVFHFATNKTQRRQYESLVNIKQREGESICDYMAHFNATILEVCDLDQSIVMTAFNEGLQKNLLLYSLEKKYP